MRLMSLKDDHGRWPLILAVLFIVIVFALGGASRADAQSQAPLRLAIIAICVFGLAWRANASFERVKMPIMLLGLFALHMAVQLIPMPPSLWRALPGRESFASLVELTGTAQQWRPLSFQPDKTLNSLLALIPPIGAALVFGSIGPARSRWILRLLLGAIAVSALLGLVQITTGNPIFYFYAITNPGAAVGVFANRNHQGVLLATALPMLAMYAASSQRRGETKVVWAAAAAAAVLVPLILVTGSRAALVLAILGAGAGWILYQPNVEASAVNDRRRPASTMVYVAGLTATAVLVLFVALSSRALSVQRLFAEDVSQEIRVRLFLPILEIAWRYFPAGTGMGTFVDIFKMHEPPLNLGSTYLNHAHNELLELAIEGGLFAVLFVAVFLWLWVRASLRIWTERKRSERGDFARLGSVVTGMMMIASLADYPLRTPIMNSVFVVMTMWLFAYERNAGQAASGK